MTHAFPRFLGDAFAVRVANRHRQRQLNASHERRLPRRDAVVRRSRRHDPEKCLALLALHTVALRTKFAGAAVHDKDGARCSGREKEEEGHVCRRKGRE